MGLAKRLAVLNLGRMAYSPALKVQEECVKRIQGTDLPGYLLMVEHTPVYTTGIRTKVYSLDEEKYLVSKGADFVRTNRGGLITFHGPGQLVVYPILNLKLFLPQANRRKAALGMKWYVHTLEEIVIQVCKGYNLTAQRSPHTGVWIGDNKICAMGVHNKDLVTSHGLALNCNIDLGWFNHIVPCGIEGKGVTSLTREIHREVTIQEVEPKMTESFEMLLDVETEVVSADLASDILDAAAPS